jgi:hypothetical protein
MDYSKKKTASMLSEVIFTMLADDMVLKVGKRKFIKFIN